ncbi:hypothetical protein HZH68_009315 [Vespula germanica]|uniref:Uncharacterized protein n=1 Tax=Vespula germanica TaxID=30212 RepID=A0A834N3D3_VESGE|nr:hypothetical protein HZH68_009315 [Vespula germanica]
MQPHRYCSRYGVQDSDGADSVVASFAEGAESGPAHGKKKREEYYSPLISATTPCTLHKKIEEGGPLSPVHQDYSSLLLLLLLLMLLSYRWKSSLADGQQMSTHGGLLATDTKSSLKTSRLGYKDAPSRASNSMADRMRHSIERTPP